MVKYTRRGLVVKRLGVLGKVQMLNLVLGMGAFPSSNHFQTTLFLPHSHIQLFVAPLVELQCRGDNLHGP